MFFSWTTGIVARLSSFRSELRQLARILPPVRKYIELVSQVSNLNETGTREEIPFGAVSFKNVSFHYGSKDDSGRGLSNISFEIQPGEMVGIVGESGAGKSTLTKLLLRGWDTDSGGIYLDNIPLVDYAPTFRRQIVYIGQEGMPFDNTVRFNLTFGGEGDVSDDVLWEKLDNAQLADRIRQTPEGLDSIVGERGIRLSGGERQRLFMAQAMIRKAKILILDEATSHLDVNTEEIIFQRAIKEASRGVTTLIVAHRFATLKSCDRIMVLDNGRLISFDTHQALMRTCSIYKELVSKQDLTLAN
jgi:ABC-type multidrug transport system fused ATPase/permease subunit